MTGLKVLNESEYTDIVKLLHKVYSGLDSATKEDHITVLYLLEDLLGAIDCAYEESYE